MPHSTDDIKAVHRKMRSWFDHEKRNGFRSGEVETAATRVLCGLYACSQKDPHPIFKAGLAHDVERWRKAMGK